MRGCASAIGCFVILLAVIAIPAAFLFGFDINQLWWGLLLLTTGVLIVIAHKGASDSYGREITTISIPKDIDKFLVRDERIDRAFELKDHTLFTSINRMFIKKGNAVRDVNYAQISSIELQSTRKWLTIICGIMLIVINFVNLDTVNKLLATFPTNTLALQQLTEGGFGWVGWIIVNLWGITGAIFIVLGYIRKTQQIKFNVTGVNTRLVLSANRNTLDALLRLVNERRAQSKSG